jgi:RNA polymerase sigma-70 factor, ECF subfamily
MRVPPCELLERLQRGDRDAFAGLVGTYHRSMLRVAAAYVGSTAGAEDAVQDTWLAVVRGLSGFEGRSSLKTWMFQVLVNRAKSRGISDRRITAIEHHHPTGHGATRQPEDLGEGVPEHLPNLPLEHVLAGEALGALLGALRRLPERQAQVLALRAIEGLYSTEVCSALDLSPENQRVLFHRARTRLRQHLR